MDSTETDITNCLRYKTPPSRKEAESIQLELQKRVITQNKFKDIRTIAGGDLAQIEKGRLVCGIVVFSYPEMEEIERVSAVVEEKFPYIPGLLAFREGPAIMEAFYKLNEKPDLLMVDGQGIAHPRGLGIASTVGVILDLPSIGVAKKKLYGRYQEPGQTQGAWTPLLSNNGNNIGAVLRTKKGIKPVFVSIGHRIDLTTAIKTTLSCTKGYRIPEPTRQADIYVSLLKTTSPK